MHFNTALPDYCGGFPSDKPVFLCGQPGALQPRRGGPSVRHWLLPQRWAELDSIVERLRGAATTAAAATTTTTAKTTKALLPRNRGKKYRGKIETEKNGKKFGGEATVTNFIYRCYSVSVVWLLLLLPTATKTSTTISVLQKSVSTVFLSLHLKHLRCLCCSCAAAAATVEFRKKNCSVRFREFPEP